MILIIVKSYHHKNTEKIAKVFAEVLNAQLKTPEQISPEEFEEYDLIGLGSGIYGGKHHIELLNLVDNLPQVANKKAFIFSTDGAPRGLIKYDSSFNDEILLKNHSLLRKKLQSKGYKIVDEFNCGALIQINFLNYLGE